MQVGFEIKGSKPKSSMNRLNLFKFLIVSSTLCLKECAICSSDSSTSFSLSSVITSTGCSENSEIIYSTDNGRDCLVPIRTCTSRNVELNGNFFVRSISNSFSFLHFVFKVTLLRFFEVILNTTHKQFSFMH